MNKSVDDLIRIANAGGGLHLDASRYPTDDLIRIANASSNKGARLHLVNTGKKSTDDLIRIANAGKGCASFE
jgi:DNA replication protein